MPVLAMTRSKKHRSAVRLRKLIKRAARQARQQIESDPQYQRIFHQSMMDLMLHGHSTTLIP